MTISAKNIPKYFHQISFPVDIRSEKGQDIVLTVSRAGLMELIEAKSVGGVGTWNKLRYLRIERPMEEITALRIKLQILPIAVDCKTTVLVSRTHSHHPRRSSAYRREGQKEVAASAV